jgi:hypothetical protein
MQTKRYVAVVAPVAGILLGFLDFVWIKYLPAPYAGLGNSIAVWAVAAFLLTYYGRRPMPPAVAAAVVMLVVAVPAYYAAAALIQHDDWTLLYLSAALVWMGFGVVAGVVFGAGGVLAGRPGRLRIPASSLPAAVLLAEAGLQLARIGDPSHPTAEIAEYVAVLLVLALVLTAWIVRPWRDRAAALLIALPVAAVGWLLLRLSSLR